MDSDPYMAQTLIEKKIDDASSVNELKISSEFLEENKKFSQTKKRYGPYNKMTREKRRQEVARLCFECGYPVTTIAKMLHVNRHTIEADIKYLCSQHHVKGFDISDFFEMQRYRVETQRARLVEKLHKEDDFEKQMVLERMISKLDNDITNLEFKFYTTNVNISDLIVKQVNEYFEYHSIEKRYYNSHEVGELPEKAVEKIRKSHQFKILIFTSHKILDFNIFYFVNYRSIMSCF